MQYLNLFVAIAAVVLIILSVHFSYARHILDKWHKVEEKANVVILAGMCGAVILFAIGWNIFRFL